MVAHIHGICKAVLVQKYIVQIVWQKGRYTATGPICTLYISNYSVATTPSQRYERRKTVILAN